MTINFKLDFIETEARIFDFAEASLQLYAQARALVLFVKKATHDLVAFFAAILALVFVLAAIPVVLLWALAFIVGLLIGISLFTYHQRSKFSMLDKLERREIIDFHVKIKHPLKRTELIRSSKFLFRTPILGALMTIYFNQLQVLEQALKVKAYPDYDKLPGNPKVHAYNPEDPWQKDTSDLKRFKDLHVN